MQQLQGVCRVSQLSSHHVLRAEVHQGVWEELHVFKLCSTGLLTLHQFIVAPSGLEQALRAGPGGGAGGSPCSGKGVSPLKVPFGASSWSSILAVGVLLQDGLRVPSYALHLQDDVDICIGIDALALVKKEVRRDLT